MRTEPRRDAAFLRDHAEGRQLGLAIEPVAGLRLERRRARAEHPGVVAPDGLTEALLAGLAGRADSAAGGVELLIARSRCAKRELLHTVAAEAGVRVAVDETRDRAEAAAVELLDIAVHRPEVGHAPHADDAVSVGQDERVLDHLDVAERAPSKRRAGAARRGELLEIADQQAAGPAWAAHSRKVGRSSSPSLAASSASSYPASACRSTPVAGSVVRTRSSRSAMSAEPSATTTMPAWIELPMPTPPPWWTLTHVAPAATLTSAFRIGQSAIASEPSSIASVSRYGDATEPEARWSRPITTGALTRPARTSSLIARPARARSPSPSQQIRAGSPWNATRSGASSSQRWSRMSSGKSVRSISSIAAMSAGSPDSAAQRNGPMPRQKSGRI